MRWKKANSYHISHTIHKELAGSNNQGKAGGGMGLRWSDKYCMFLGD